MQQHEDTTSESADCAQRFSVQQQKGMIIAIRKAIDLFVMESGLLIVFGRILGIWNKITQTIRILK